MENQANGALQDMPFKDKIEKEKFEFADLIPYLLFFLVLAVSYLGVTQYAGQKYPWFLTLLILNGCFLARCIQSSIELRKSRQAEAKTHGELCGQLAEAGAQMGRKEEELAETADKLRLTDEGLTSAKAELEQTNVLFEKLSLDLEIAESELKSLKSETEAILANVKQGVFLINSEGTISGQYSEELKGIFQIPDAASRNFMRLMRPLVPEKHHQTISNYIALLFNPRKNSKQLQKFNPLKRVELNFQRAEGGFAPKSVEFNFQRVYSDEQIARVLVTAVDVSERIQLEGKLREEGERREKQLSLLCDLLNADPVQLRAFLKEAEAVMTSVNTSFREASSEAVPTETTQERVNRVFRAVHKLKSQATALGLPLLEREIHRIEDLLNDLRRNPAASNQDLITVLVSISKFQSVLKEAQELMEKISGMSRAAVPDTHSAATPSSELMAASEELVRTCATRAGKHARIEWAVSGFDNLPLNLQTALRDATFQLVRNCVVHGIEAPEKRQAEGKDGCGVINVTINIAREAHAVHLVCRDDGAGLDVEAIRSKAVREGLLSAEKAALLTQNEILPIIFEPGFSTAASVTEDAGRGVGLDALHDSISGQLKGEIQMEFGTGRYCQFELLVPLI
ncbi:MAG: ATP-binding protein [Chthoniobacteraceae bacterium]